MAGVKLTKLDRRHRGYGVWTWHAVRPMQIMTLKDARNTFYAWREWCWGEWGPSKELDMFADDDLFDGRYSSNQHWCWVNDKVHGFRIYLRGDYEAAAFSLRWA